MNVFKFKPVALFMLVAFVLAGFVFVVNMTMKTKPDSKDAIVIPLHNWSSQIVMAHVIGHIFESIGNNVEYVQHADSQSVYESVRNGDVTISHEVWQSSFGEAFDAAMKKGGLIDAGNHDAVTQEDLGVPQYVIDKNLCPGLPDWKALRKCKDVFSTADSKGKGIILEGPKSWHGNLMPNRIKALGLNKHYKVRFAKGAMELWTTIAEGKKEGKGVIVFNWTPNFTDADGFVFIKFPPYYDGCRIADGGDGKCGSPTGWMKKAAHYKFPVTHPKAYFVYTKIVFTTKHIGEMAALVDVDQMSHKDAAKKWIKDNEKVWKSFTKGVSSH